MSQSQTEAREGDIWVVKESGIASLNAGCWLTPEERDRLTLEVSYHLQIDEVPDGAEIGTVRLQDDGTIEFTLDEGDIERYGFDSEDGAVTRRIST